MQSEDAFGRLRAALADRYRVQRELGEGGMPRGIRLALGGRSPDVLRLIIRQTVMLALAGIAAGLTVAYAAANVMRGLLFSSITPTDPLTFIVVPAVLAASALLASWIPAWRATRIDPVRALRTEA